MPYKVGASNLPKHVRNSPTGEQKAWVNAYNSKFNEKKKQGASLSACEQAAFEYANGVLKKIQGRTGPPVKESVTGIAKSTGKQKTETKSPDSGLAVPNAEPTEKEEGRNVAESVQAKVDELITESAARDVPKDLEVKIKTLIDEASGKNCEPGKALVADIDEALVPPRIARADQVHPNNEGPRESFAERVDEVLVTLREAAQMKTEGGTKFPASAFAYVPDSAKPSTWKLRLAEQGKGVTRAQLGRAAAAFSPGGFRGQKVQIPSGDVSKVKAKIRAAYRKLGVDDGDIPKWVKEVEPRALVGELGGVEISEATAEKVSSGTLPVRFLAPGFNTDKSRYYTERAIQDAVRIFEGQKMFANHPTKTEDRELPERSMWGWVANLRNCRVSPSGNAVGDAVIHDGRFKEKVQGLQEAGELTELGTSIIGVGKGVKTTLQDVKTHMIEGIVKGRSVDFVTEPGAGGRAGLRESIAAEGYDPNNDVDLLDETALRERRPDLVANIETQVEVKLQEEFKAMEELKAKITELEGQITTLTEERDGLKTELEEAEKKERVAEAQKKIAELVDAADLKEASKIRVKDQFTGAESEEGVAEAIEAETKYVAALNEAGAIRDMGRTETEDDSEEARKRMRESAKRRYLDDGKTEAEAERMADIYVTG